MSPCAEERHAKTKGNSSWEEICAPIDCSFYSINISAPGQTFDKASDTQDSDQQVLGMTNFSVMGASHGSHRWNQGELITYVRSSSPLNLYFLK